MKIFVTGDLHGDPQYVLSSKMFPEGKSLTKDDLVIVCGDFGLVFAWPECRWSKEEQFNLNWLNNKPWTTLFIGGNHENWDRLHDFETVDTKWGKLAPIASSVYFIPNGTLLTLGDKTAWCMGGAMSTDRGDLDPNVVYPEEGRGWWREEIPSKSEMDLGIKILEDVDWKVNFIFTHTMPSEYVDELCKDIRDHSYRQRITDPTARYLSFIRNNVTVIDGWYCGHFHRNEVYGDTTIIYNKVIEIS